MKANKKSSNTNSSELIEAIRNNDEASINALLSLGTPVNSTTDYGSPLIIAAENGFTSLVKLLVEAGADVNLPSKSGNTPLRAAILGGEGECISKIIEYGANVDAVTSRGTPLMAATVQGDCDTIALLIEKGADPNLEAKDGLTALIVGVREDQKEAVKQLLHLGAQATRKNRDGVDALTVAEEKVLPEIYALLVQSHISANADEVLAASEKRQTEAVLEMEETATRARKAGAVDYAAEQVVTEHTVQEITDQSDDLIRRLGLTRRMPPARPNVLKAMLAERPNNA